MYNLDFLQRIRKCKSACSAFCNSTIRYELIFYANYLDSIEYYHSQNDSFQFLNELLRYQLYNDKEEIYRFVCNCKSWFNKKGWTQKIVNSLGKLSFEMNTKINCLSFQGPPKSGKNYFFDCVAAISLNILQISRVNFTIHDRRFVIGNEISMEEEVNKKLCERVTLNVRVKFQGENVF